MIAVFESSQVIVMCNQGWSPLLSGLKFSDKTGCVLGTPKEPRVGQTVIQKQSSFLVIFLDSWPH